MTDEMDVTDETYVTDVTDEMDMIIVTAAMRQL